MSKTQIHEMRAVLLSRKIDEAILDDGVLSIVRGTIHGTVELPVATNVFQARIDTCTSVRKEFTNEPNEKNHFEENLVFCKLLHAYINEQMATQIIWHGYKVRQNTHVKIALITDAITYEQYATNRKNSK